MAQVMVLVKIMLTVVLLDPRSFDTFTLPKSVAAHATSLVIAALLVWLVARHGRSVLVWSPLHVAVGALLLAFALATPFALDPTLALFGTFKRYLGLTQMLDNALLYLSVATLFRDTRSQRLLAGVGVGVALPVLAYALIQRLGLDPLRFQQGGTRLPISFLGNPDLVGGFVSIEGVTALGLALLLPGRLLTWYRIALAAVGPACLGILYTTGVRAGALGIAAGWIAVIVLASRLPGISRSRKLSALLVAPLFALGVVVSPIGARLSPDYVRNDPAVISRLDIWRAASIALVERPILGLGPDDFAAAYPSRRTQASIRTGELQNSTHDVWLYMATSAGIVGLAAFALLVVLAIDRALREASLSRSAALALVPLAAYLGQALVNVNEIVIDQMFWISLGVIAAGSATALAVQGRRPAVRTGRPLVGVLALGAAAVTIALGIAPRVVAGESLLATEAYANAGHPRTAIPYARTMIAADPRRGDYWSSYGGALDKAHWTTLSVAAFSIAARVQPWQPLSWENLALVWNELGNQTAAYSAARRIPIADPYDGVGRALLSEFAYDHGDFALSAAEGERALRYELNLTSSAYFITISAYAHLKELPRAEALARQATAKFPTAQLRLQFAAILADEGKKPEAISVLDALLKQQPKNADALALKEALTKP